MRVNTRYINSTRGTSSKRSTARFDLSLSWTGKSRKRRPRRRKKIPQHVRLKCIRLYNHHHHHHHHHHCHNHHQLTAVFFVGTVGTVFATITAVTDRNTFPAAALEFVGATAVSWRGCRRRRYNDVTQWATRVRLGRCVGCVHDWRYSVTTQTGELTASARIRHLCRIYG